jgi:uncharacterized protein YjbI with pentapeptide repeats
MTLDNPQLDTQIEAGRGRRWGMAGPDIKAVDALPIPVLGKETPAPEPDTKNLDALLASLNGSAERFQTLWFSFLGLTLYLAIAASATTHRNLLLGEPQVLPILNIKVELLPFYVIAPLLYLRFHFYLLMMLVLLARTAAEFDKLLRTTIADEADQEHYRARVENALFLQLLVGMKGERSGVNSFLLGLISPTIVLAPLATLVLMQMMFLPYHHLRITWWHRGIVVVDLVLIVVLTYRCFFPRGLKKAPLALGALNRKSRAAAMAVYILLAVGLTPLADWLSFRQGRWAGEPWPSFDKWRWWAGEQVPFATGYPDFAATANGVVFGLFPDRLILSQQTIVGESRLDETKKEIASRGGDFVPTLNFDGRDLRAAALAGADLRGASFYGAAMQEADLSLARLDGAVLNGAHLQGASLLGARLHGASLLGAQFNGADLRGAQLWGAQFAASNLEGALLNSAQLQGVDLFDAFLPGADLRFAQLQGVDFSGAWLPGAQFDNAQLQGAHFGTAVIADSEFNQSFVYRADVMDADLATVSMRGVRADAAKLRYNEGSVSALTSTDILPLTSADVDRWTAEATEFAAETQRRYILARFARLQPSFRTPEQDAADQLMWNDLEKRSLPLDPDATQHRRRLAIILGDLACKPEGAPYVARLLVAAHTFLAADSTPRSVARLASLGDQLDSVRARMKAARKEPAKCPGVAGFTEDDWRRLDAIKPIEPAPTNH